METYQFTNMDTYSSLRPKKIFWKIDYIIDDKESHKKYK